MTKSLAGLAALLAWQVLTLGRFISREARPPAWDQANHLEVAWRYHAWAKAGAWGAIWRYTPNGTMPPFPPLYHLALAWVYGFSRSPSAFLWINAFYLAVLLAAVFALGRRCGGPASGLAAAALLACSPLVQQLLRTQLVDLALMAVTAAAYWALLLADEFANPAGSLLFGVACAVGMLHKWSFFTYMLPAAWIWRRALRDGRRRGPALAAAAIGLGGALPWYLIRLPLVVVRLKQASTDFVVPFWKGGAFFHYLSYMADGSGGLGLPLLLLSGWAIWSLRRGASRPQKLLLQWALTSYVLWALVPNRQLRFLAPGLCGLAALAASAAPRPLVWLVVAFQLAGAVRAARGPLAPVSADWEETEILAAIRSRGGEGLQAVSVIANDERFNKLDFIWYADLAGMDVQFRGVNDVPWELSPWVVFKTGRLGPAAVVSEFLPAQAAIARRDGWFSLAFEERGRWPLPDGSPAVLSGRRRRAAPPRRGPARLPLYFSSLLEVPSALVTASGWDARAGAYRRVDIQAPRAFAQGLEIDGTRLSLQDALLVPDSEDGPAGAKLVRVGSARVLAAAVTPESLRRRLERGPARLRALSLDGSVRATASVKGLPVSVEAVVSSDAAHPCRAALKRLDVAGLPLPPELALRYGANGPLLELETKPGRTIVRTVFGLSRETPFEVSLTGCSASDGRLSIP